MPDCIGAAVLIASSGLWFQSPAGAAPPTPPPAVRAVAVSPTEVDVDWEPGGPDTTSYVVRRNGGLRATVDAATLTFADTTVMAGSHYLYLVEAVGPGGTSISPPAHVKTPSPPQGRDQQRPTVPDDVHARAQTDGSVLIDWQYSDDNSDISAYLVRRDHRPLAVVDAGTLRYVDRRSPSATAQYTVEALDIARLRSGESSPAPVEPATAAALPAVPAPGARSLTTTAFASALRRYPYLTDVVNSADATTGYATINWATDRSATTGAAVWGIVDGAGSCTPATSVTATRTALTVNSVAEYQWKAMLTLLPDTQYCYRITLGSLDLLGSDASPRFRTQVPTGSSTPFSFAVFGDWGSVDSVSSQPGSGQRSCSRSRRAAPRFALTTGDNAYSSGSQNNYGDLVEVGPEIERRLRAATLDRARARSRSSRPWATTASAQRRRAPAPHQLPAGPSRQRLERALPEGHLLLRPRHVVAERARARGTRSTPGGRGSTCCRPPGRTPTAA